MLWGMLWIVGGYGAAAVLLHIAHAVQKRRGRKPAATTFALLTCNNEAQIEWYLRSLVFVSRLRGRMISIVLFDEQSVDDTLTIADKIANERSRADIRIMEESLDSYLAAHSNDRIVLYRISGIGSGQHLTVLQG